MYRRQIMFPIARQTGGRKDLTLYQILPGYIAVMYDQLTNGSKPKLIADRAVSNIDRMIIIERWRQIEKTPELAATELALLPDPSFRISEMVKRTEKGKTGGIR